MRDQDGSVIVAATAFIVILGVVVGAAAARSASVSAGALGAHERVVARTAAEHGLRIALGDLEANPSRIDILRRAVLDRPLEIDRAMADGSTVDEVGLTAHARSSATGSDRVVVSVDVSVGAAAATASSVVRPRLTSDLLLMTEHRALDPALHGVPRAACMHPLGHPRRDARCLDAALAVAAVDGPVHTNEVPVAAMPGGGAVVTTSARVPGVRHRSELELPRSVGAVVGDLPVTCRFRGPTLLRFDGPTVRVRSPRSVPRAEEPSDPSLSIGCMGVDRTLLAQVVAIELPERAIIEVVRDDDTACFTHPLGISAEEDAVMDWMCDSGDAFVWGRYRGARTVLAEDSVQIAWDVEPGDATSAAPLADGDVLGLVAGDSIVLRRPVGPPEGEAWFGVNIAFAGPGIPPFGPFPLDAPTSAPTTWAAPRVVAALAALRGSVTVQNVFRGQEHAGGITVVGSVASRFTPVSLWEHFFWGTPFGSTGYVLDLRYDPRLDIDPPPAMPMVDGGRLRIIELDVG
jgi:hypothetical protein